MGRDIIINNLFINYNISIPDNILGLGSNGLLIYSIIMSNPLEYSIVILGSKFGLSKFIIMGIIAFLL